MTSKPEFEVYIERKAVGIGIGGLVLISGLLYGVHGKCRAIKDQTCVEILENLTKEGTVEVRDVNGDGLDDLVVGYKDTNGKNQKVIFYKTDRGYFTAEQLKEQTIREAAGRYSEKVPAEAQERK
jgi:hypothetical protein